MLFRKVNRENVVVMAVRNSRQTSPKAAAQASKVLSNPSSTKAEKGAAASALSQAAGSKGQTGPKAAAQASAVLSNPKSTKAEKASAASTLAQTPKSTKKK